MATTHLQIPDIAASQNQKEVTANAAHDLLDKKIVQRIQVTVTTDASFSDAAVRENTLIELIGTPGTPRTLDMNDTNENRLAILNNTDDVMTINNSAGAGGSNDIPIIQIGETVTFQYDGVNFDILGRSNAVGFIPLDFGSARYLDSDDIPNADSAGAGDSSGGLLALDTTPAYERVATTTDKALRIMWVVTNVDEVQFSPVPMPPDIDATQDLTIHLLARMSGTVGPDNPTIDVQVFDGIGDTEMGGVTAAVTSTLAELTRTIVAADITGSPLGFLNISLTPGAHANDEVEVYAAWIEYAK